MTVSTVLVSNSECIVLRRIPYADTSLIVHLFSRDQGRVAALAKGAFRPKSPHFAGLDLLDFLEAKLMSRSEQPLALLTASNLTWSPRSLRSRPGALAVALFALELVDTALAPTPMPVLYARFSMWLRWLDALLNPSAGELARGLLTFELHFLRDIGMNPNFSRCILCEVTIPWTEARVSFSVHSGGVACGSCAQRLEKPTVLSRAAREYAAQRTQEHGGGPDPNGEDLRDLRNLLDRFHAFHLERTLRARPSIEAIFRSAERES